MDYLLVVGIWTVTDGVGWLSMVDNVTDGPDCLYMSGWALTFHFGYVGFYW